ncbi:MAG: nitrite/sulfite reductase, partial [Alphaproteobacteria bacterium]|nr:nitrite/sulfite reductase [Alphaproteobacteria bacterium]
KGYGHFTTRQNIQFNWPDLEDVPKILADLAQVEMHAIQTSGNCIRNVTADPFAGAAIDEIDDSRVYAEVLRQWSTLHPEFSFLPRKFKFAVSASETDRAIVRFHDVGVILKRNEAGEEGFEVLVGGGQGRTPMVAVTIRDFLPKEHLLSYVEAVLRVYNLLGRRDDMYKARIKILVHEIGAEKFAALTEEEWQFTRESELHLPDSEIARIRAYFAPPAYEDIPAESSALEDALGANAAFARWHTSNVTEHRQAGYAIASVSLKPTGGIPGDASADQMDAIADMALDLSFDEIRVTHEQNVVLAHVRKDQLFELWQRLGQHDLATPNVSLITDVICCPGMDYCSLATARSVPVSQRISERFRDLDRQHDIGALDLNISGCINACGHHHAGHIGILGVDKRGKEFYQITLGGHQGYDASIGKIIGPAFSSDAIVDAVEDVVTTYLEQRQDGEQFLDTYRRVGALPFKEKLYDVA